VGKNALANVPKKERINGRAASLEKKSPKEGKKGGKTDPSRFDRTGTEHSKKGGGGGAAIFSSRKKNSRQGGKIGRRPKGGDLREKTPRPKEGETPSNLQKTQWREQPERTKKRQKTLWTVTEQVQGCRTLPDDEKPEYEKGSTGQVPESPKTLATQPREEKTTDSDKEIVRGGEERTRRGKKGLGGGGVGGKKSYKASSNYSKGEVAAERGIVTPRGKSFWGKGKTWKKLHGKGGLELLRSMKDHEGRMKTQCRIRAEKD